MKPFTTFSEAFAYLCSITNYEKEPAFHTGLLRPVFDLRAIHRLLDQVGGPHRYGRFIHITGTKGKGSTALMVTHLLTALGFKVGTYTSPHLTDLTERIAVNGAPVTRDRIVEYLNELYPAMKQAAEDPDRPNPTFFEILTATAFLHFAREKTDFSVMEVGLGGRLDSTNVILPLVAVITNIGKDHTKVLGERLEDIAREKAGIIKEGVPVITAEPAGTGAFKVIESIAAERNAPLLTVDESMAVQDLQVRKRAPRGLSFSLVSGRREYPDLFVPLFGRHQARNASAAVLALEVLEEKGHISLSPSGVKEAFSRFRLHGRTEVLSEKPLFVLDGAHNPLAVEKMRETLEESFDFERMIVVFAAAADKDLKGIMDVLLPVVDVIIFSRTNSPRTAKWKDYEILRQANPGIWNHVEALDEPDYKKAVQRAFHMAGERDLVLATGSFYLVGDILAWKKGKLP